MKMGSAFSWALLGAAGALYWLGTRQQTSVRQPSVEEIDSPEVVSAYLRLMQLPPSRAFRAGFAAFAVRGRAAVRVLDVGCGAGQLALALAQRHEVREVIGIDLSSELLDAARQTAELAGANATFLQEDAAEMTFPDASFDVVVSTISLHHWRRPEEVLRAINRVLSPGGQAIIFDLRRDASPLMLGSVFVASRYLLPAGLRETGEPLSSFQAAFTPCEAILLAAKAGWDDPHVATGAAWLVLKMEKSERGVRPMTL